MAGEKMTIGNVEIISLSDGLLGVRPLQLFPPVFHAEDWGLAIRTTLPRRAR